MSKNNNYWKNNRHYNKKQNKDIYNYIYKNKYDNFTCYKIYNNYYNNQKNNNENKELNNNTKLEPIKKNYIHYSDNEEEEYYILFKENDDNSNPTSFLLANLLNKSDSKLNKNEEIIDNETKEYEKEEEKIYKWIKFEINSLDDLILIGKNYGSVYTDEYNYNLDIKIINSMVNELEDLNKMIGLTNIKKYIVDIILYYALKLENKNKDLLHTVIEGEPGTGKTELAEKLSKIFLKMGILKNNIFKKVKRSDLIAGYLGQTAIKTIKLLEECKGGVLFIDEAYSLGNAEGKDGKDSFSKECIDTLNQYLTENKSDFICIIAGYKEDLEKSFFSFNSGLERRFPIRFSIDSYSDDELAKIFIKKIYENEWNIDCSDISELIKKYRNYFKFNGGDMENLFAKCKITHAKNLLLNEFKSKKVLDKEDINDGLKLFINNPEVKRRIKEEESNNYLSFYI